ncbi:MAG: D-alanyl-D-alanine carboxypeptidase [Clostridiales bacterium]|nr:D-alanyl-D-alanine carboxypeptidase [Clostridiales bacterium]
MSMKILRKYLRNIIIFILVAMSISTGQVYGQTETENIDIDIDIEVIPDTEGETPNTEIGVSNLTSEGAVVIEQKSAKVLYGKNENQQLFPASTTKVLTALLALEHGDLNELITVGEELDLLAWDGSMAGLEKGEEITLQNLIYGLLINSGNDAANTIAVHIARKVSGESLAAQEALDYFASMMNKRAREAGARNSNFVNPHGYHDPMHYTTPYDLALIGSAAIENELFREVINVSFVQTAFWASGLPRFWVSRNKLTNEKETECYYENAIGSKTGYTSKAGSCLISFANKDGQDLVSVVMKSTSGEQWHETRELFEYGFTNFKYMNVIKKDTIIDSLQVDNSASDDLGTVSVKVSADDWGYAFNKKDIGQIKQEIIWDPSLMSEKATEDIYRLEAPIEKDQKIGELRLTLHGEELKRFPLTAVRSVKRIKNALDILTPDLPSSNEGKSEFSWPFLILVIVALFLFMRLMIILNQRKRQRQRQRYISSRRYW